MQRLQAGGEAAALVYFGGTVHEKGNSQKPLAGIQVAVKGTGLFDTTDHLGRFRLGGLLPGDYILVAWMPGGKPIERPVTLPAVDGNYDVMV